MGALGSLDGGAFQRLGGANPTLPPFRSYRSDHRAVVLDLPVPEVAARFLELRVPPQNQFAVFVTHNDGRWGVHELDVFAR